MSWFRSYSRLNDLHGRPVSYKIHTDSEKYIMFNAIKFKASRRDRTSMFGVFFFAMAMVLLPISARAQCSKTWDASGEWEIRQGPVARTTVIRLNLQQSGSALSGTASRNVRTGSTKGKVTGDADGDNFTLGIDWLDGSGEYTTYRAMVAASGKLEGETYIGPNKRDRDTWYSEQPLTCGWRPGQSRGNLTSRLSASAPVQTSQATGSLLKGPSIVASQAVFPTPYVTTGFVVLTWDAGPDHPNADVWFKSGRDRVLLMKQPKAGQQIVVQRGQMYEYVLMDGRTVLATAIFVAN